MVRRNVDPTWKFSNGTYIFAHDFQQIDPSTQEGKVIESILSRQHKDRVDSRPQKYRAEVIHNKDINNDGVIGDPETSGQLRKRIDKDIKKKRKSKKKVSLPEVSLDDVAVSDSNNTVRLPH